MAKQTGKTKLQGRVGDIIYYKMNGQYYARAVSSLSRKRVRTSPAFERTRQFAGIMGMASKAASKLYRQFPREWKKKQPCFFKMAGLANSMLIRGKTLDEVNEALIRQFAPPAMRQELLVQSKPVAVADQKVYCSSMDGVIGSTSLKVKRAIPVAGREIVKRIPSSLRVQPLKRQGRKIMMGKGRMIHLPVNADSSPFVFLTG